VVGRSWIPDRREISEDEEATWAVESLMVKGGNVNVS